MNETRLPAAQVEVVVSDCSPSDAGNLFAVLRAGFPSGHDAIHEPHRAEGTRPMVWTDTFDTSGPAEKAPSRPAPLSGPVTAEVQGSPLAVRQLCETLEHVFTVHEVGETSGDQEVQVQLRLEGRYGGLQGR